MVIQQPPFSFTKLIYSAITRTPRELALFQPFAISVDNFFPHYKVLNGFESLFGSVDHRPNFVFNATFPLMLQCICQSSIPSNLLGLIHISSEIIPLKKQNWRLPSVVSVELMSATENEKGILYEIRTSVWQNKELTIVNINKMLDKNRYYKGSSASVSQDNNISTELASYKITQKMVRNYASISRDYNPIHISNWLAKRFGLKGAIVHGMYNAHLAINEVMLEEDNKNGSLLVEFNKPCFIPANMVLTKTEDAYSMYSADLSERFVKISFRSAQ